MKYHNSGMNTGAIYPTIHKRPDTEAASATNFVRGSSTPDWEALDNRCEAQSSLVG